MQPSKKILAVAIAGSLFATRADAIVDLSDDASAPITIASELVINPAGTSIASVGHRTDVQSSVGYAFAPGEIRYVRFECSPNVRFTATSNVDYLEAGAISASASTGAVNGGGTSAITFSITANAAGVGDAPSDRLLVHGGKILTDAAPATCSYGLYDQPSQAATGGTVGRVASFSAPFLQFESGYAFTATEQNTAVANVEAVPAFTRFVADAGSATATTARLARLEFEARAGEQLRANGQDVTLTDLFAAGTRIEVAGDFTAARNDDGSYGGGALNRVFLAAAADCSGAATAATSVAGELATFTVGATPNANPYLCLATEGTPAIPEADYTATLVAVPADADVYDVASTGPLQSGAVVRNGTELQAPLVQVPNGWLSRVALTNTGSLPRTYTIQVQGESGNTISTGTTLAGTIPGNGTRVVDLRGNVLSSFTQQARATLVVNVAGPSTQVQGLYQIVNPQSGSISNHVMVRPGSN